MRVEVAGQVVRVTKRQVRDLERTVNWLDHHPQWATCGGDLDAYGLREPGLVFTRWHGDNFVMAPTKLGWALLIHLHPNLRGGAPASWASPRTGPASRLARNAADA